MDYAVAMEMVVILLRSMIKKLHLEATLAVKKQKHLMLHHLLQLHKPLLLLHLQLLTPILFQRFLPAQRKHSLPPPQRLRSKHSLPPRQRLRSKHSLPPPQKQKKYYFHQLSQQTPPLILHPLCTLLTLHPLCSLLTNSPTHPPPTMHPTHTPPLCTL